MNPLKNLLLSFLFLSSFFSSSAQINLTIQPSATSGIAPMYVFFDATSTTGLTGSNDLVNTDFTWNFDQTNIDPNGNWEATKGMVAGHVFEIPGTYTISCTATAPDGTTDTESVTISVTAFSGTTYYVSNLGDDSNDGLTPSTAWQTANFAFSQLTPNEQILFHRGDTFSNVNYNLQNLSGGTMIIGAYGSGSKPILDGTSAQNILELDFVEDLSIIDLHLVVNPNGAGAGNFSIEDSEDILLHDLDLEGSTSLAIYFDDCDKIAVFDSEIHDFGVLAIFSGDGTRLSWVGNTVDNLIGTPQPEHAVRIQRGEKHFISNNTFTNLINTKSTIQIRGDNQRHVMIYQNKMDRILGINPTNAASIQAISNVTIEGNYVGQNSDYTGTTWENSINGINIEATNIAVRNNVIDGYTNAINVAHDYNGVVSGWVDVYHNTVNWRSVSPQSGTGGFITRVRDVSNVNVVNNFITASNVSQVDEVSYGGTNTNIIANDNIIATPSDYAVAPLPPSEADANDIANYLLISSSNAIDAGANNIPVFFDATPINRDIGMPDVGAFEFIAPLPVELSSFEVRVNNQNEVELDWVTETEQNNSHFLLQKSSDGIQWETFHLVKSQGNSNTRTTYFALDNSPYENISYYRLKQIDFNNHFSYSPIRGINLTYNTFNIFPNPANNFLSISCPQLSTTQHLQILNSNGRLVLKKLISSTNHQIDLNHLTDGIYTIQMIANQKVFSKRFIKYSN